jgi:hypothetical protein
MSGLEHYREWSLCNKLLDRLKLSDETLCEIAPELPIADILVARIIEVEA